MSMRAPEAWRVTQGIMGTTALDGCNGYFLLPSVIPGRKIRAIASDGEGWEHVSVSILQGKHRPMPTWDEMCAAKSAFWGPEDAVMQLHPPASAHVNFHKTCLHLWRPINQPLPLPSALMVGPTSQAHLDELRERDDMIGVLARGVPDGGV